MDNDVVFLLDVDNTLLDNDTAQDDYLAEIRRAVSPEAAERYWNIFRDAARRLGYADYLGALQRYRMEDRHDPKLLHLSSYMLDYDFKPRLYPGALELITHLHTMGTPVILSDGDVVFQPRKIFRSGLWDAVRGKVFVSIHKDQELYQVYKAYPARHYVMVDDKLRLLSAVKKHWGEQVTTVFVRQGHYAVDADALAGYPPADIMLERIGEMLDFDLKTLLRAAVSSA